MTDPLAATRQVPSRALQHMREHGSISLTGRASDPFLRWQKRRRISLIVFLVIGGLGVLSAVLGLLLRDVAVWALLIPVGGLFAFVGFVAAGALAVLGSAHRFRLHAETQPVVLDPRGVCLRGIGPVPWSDLEAPEYRRIFTKNDLSGMCAVMPLSAQGHARVNASHSPRTLLIGPRPYLRTDVPYLLLPGIDGFTEAETVQLFQTAHAMHAR
ncbi:hypothetical protein SAMN02982929_03746 [Saccharopolyspora kobensis]|uniref:Uncharacterized protein n=1 Tax=Saccharopolyspora kobensis TaxID=146035 RepID=A0A1H6D033_9PSEU|nr:hypothetical protein [Saccharopolyspora kobensis]SEG78378.1 hypothetical protein SAMN02982929_03746 [Saccharopolyspora kobensis]SFD05221.1 hypothetical protein SAMN05216506_102341 [Saccharopolyspora kobensis]